MVDLAQTPLTQRAAIGPEPAVTIRANLQLNALTGDKRVSVGFVGQAGRPDRLVDPFRGKAQRFFTEIKKGDDATLMVIVANRQNRLPIGANDTKRGNGDFRELGTRIGEGGMLWQLF